MNSQQFVLFQCIEKAGNTDPTRMFLFIFAGGKLFIYDLNTSDLYVLQM